MSDSSMAATMADVNDGQCRQLRRPLQWPTSRRPRRWPTSTMADVDDRDGYADGRSRRTPLIAHPTMPPPPPPSPPPHTASYHVDIHHRCLSGNDVPPLLRGSSPRHSAYATTCCRHPRCRWQWHHLVREDRLLRCCRHGRCCKPPPHMPSSPG